MSSIIKHTVNSWSNITNSTHNNQHLYTKHYNSSCNDRIFIRLSTFFNSPLKYSSSSPEDISSSDRTVNSCLSLVSVAWATPCPNCSRQVSTRALMACNTFSCVSLSDVSRSSGISLHQLCSLRCLVNWSLQRIGTYAQCLINGLVQDCGNFIAVVIYLYLEKDWFDSTKSRIPVPFCAMVCLALMTMCENKSFLQTGHVTLTAISGTTSLGLCLQAKLALNIWRSGTCR